MAGRELAAIAPAFSLAMTYHVDMSVATKTPLPDDLAAAHRLIREQEQRLAQQQLLIERMQRQLEQLLRQRFGPKSEKLHPDQLLLFGETAVPLPPAPPEPGSKAKSGHGRQQLPAGLPRQEIVHDLTPEQKLCPECGDERAKIGEATSEQLEYVPASLRVLVHTRPK
jgi:transposase